MAQRKQKPTADIVNDLLGGRPSVARSAPGKENTVAAGPKRRPAKKKTAPQVLSDNSGANVSEPERTPARPTVSGKAGKLYFVAFRIGRRHYALPLEEVAAVLRMVAITPLPETPPWVTGVINLHGRVVPVVDVRQRLDHGARRPHRDDRLLVVADQARQVALMVEDATRVMAVSPDLLEQPDLLNTSKPVVAVVRDDDNLTMILDLADLIPAGAAAADIQRQLEQIPNQATGSRDEN